MRRLWEWQHGIQWMHCERMTLYPVSIMENSDCNAWVMRVTTWHPVDALWGHDPLSSQYTGDQWLQCVGYESDNMASSGCDASTCPSIQSVLRSGACFGEHEQTLVSDVPFLTGNKTVDPGDEVELGVCQIFTISPTKVCAISKWHYAYLKNDAFLHWVRHNYTPSFKRYV